LGNDEWQKGTSKVALLDSQTLSQSPNKLKRKKLSVSINVAKYVSFGVDVAEDTFSLIIAVEYHSSLT